MPVSSHSPASLALSVTCMNTDKLCFLVTTGSCTCFSSPDALLTLDLTTGTMMIGNETTIIRRIPEVVLDAIGPVDLGDRQPAPIRLEHHLAQGTFDLPFFHDFAAL